ncbi:MAG: ribosomal protein S18-alanine N-acetyltransferase [Heliobacteriaceae bacterium]|jgi:ribosomal-protein-alanine N-acetyltransferase|nr:ribosomal protein S18-alanine N-acetyltransferase [Heliobacteriaceae bacterium]
MKTETLKILPMKRDDVEAVIKIEESAYGEHHWSSASFYNELSNELAHYFCAFNEQDELIAYSGCWQILEEAHITNIAVSPEHRRKHIAEKLLINTIEDCYKNKVKYITLEVRVSNTPAIKLYEKYNFKSLGTRKCYYQNNDEDALIMWTENIFYDKFKNKFEENTAKLKGKI